MILFVKNREICGACGAGQQCAQKVNSQSFNRPPEIDLQVASSDLAV